MKIKNLLIALFCLSAFNLFADRDVFNMNPGWQFFLGEPAGAEKVDFDDSKWDLVSVPHSMRIFSADLSDFKTYGRRIGWYRKKIEVPNSWQGKKVHLEFQGAMQATVLYVNGKKVGDYYVSGYDSFSFDITKYLKNGENLIAVMVDNRVNPNLPPDGITHDFVLFGGLYRDVNVVVTGEARVPFAWEKADAGVRVTYPQISKKSATVKVDTCVNNESFAEKTIVLETKIAEKKGAVVATISSTKRIPAGGSFLFKQELEVKNPKLWSPDTPNLYIVTSKVMDGANVSDTVSTQVGLRWVVFDKEKGFFLNGEHLKLIGTNRHQNWPYITGAVSNENHRADALQLKSLGINWIRCSHYPHDPDFLTALDEIGLMALEEGPTWMHAGPEEWVKNLEKSFISMVRRDRNHPSIIIWNACINHERKTEPYLEAAGRAEDPSRALGQATADYGVYCPMDFNHKRVSGNNALTLEYTGHTYPTSRGEYDREIEQAKRHMEMYRIALDTPGNHGLASWCGYDYNSFYNAKESVPRHGIFDLFRLPKLSYWWHRSELTDDPIAHIVKSKKRVIVYSNADKIVLFGGNSKNSLKELATLDKPVDGKLKNPPYHFYLANDVRFLKAVGYKDGKHFVTGEWSQPGFPKSIELVSSREFIYADGADVARVEVSLLDENGAIAKSALNSVTFTLEGNGQLLGQNPVQVIAGRHIILVQSGYTSGVLKVTARSEGMEASIDLRVKPMEGKVLYPVQFVATKPTPLCYKIQKKMTGVSNRLVEPFSFKPITAAKPGVWVESEPVLLGGLENAKATITIKGGEYRIYTSEYSTAPGTVGGGDAVFVRVKSSPVSGEKVVATVKIGDKKADFEVTTR